MLGWAARKNIEVFGIEDEIRRLNCAAVPVTAAELGRRSDLVVSLGGDGTMLRAMRLADRQRAPVLGVNLGKLGFLAEVDVPDLPGALSAIDSEQFTIEPRLAVDSALGPQAITAFNDVAVVRVPGQGSAVVTVHVGRPAVRQLRGRRRGRCHPDRLDRLQLLGGRPDREPDRGGAAGDTRGAALGLQPRRRGLRAGHGHAGGPARQRPPRGRGGRDGRRVRRPRRADRPAGPPGCGAGGPPGPHHLLRACPPQAAPHRLRGDPRPRGPVGQARATAARPRAPRPRAATVPPWASR